MTSGRELSLWLSRTTLEYQNRSNTRRPSGTATSIFVRKLLRSVTILSSERNRMPPISSATPMNMQGASSAGATIVSKPDGNYLVIDSGQPRPSSLVIGAPLTCAARENGSARDMVKFFGRCVHAHIRRHAVRTTDRNRETNGETPNE